MFGTRTSLYKFPICVPQNDTERVRVGTITDHARHDLAVGPADKFQFVYLLSKADKHILKQECNIRIPKINVKCLIFFMF